MSRSHSFLLTAVAMGILAVALSMNFGLANTIVQEHAPAPLRGRVSAVFGLSFFGLMPIAGLVIPGFSDLIGMRTALAISSVIFGVAASRFSSLAGRHVCDQRISPAPEPEIAPVADRSSANDLLFHLLEFPTPQGRRCNAARNQR